MARGGGSAWRRQRGLALASALRRARLTLHASPFYRWRYSGQMPERLLIAPTDLRTADPTIAHDIYAGRFVFAGEVIEVSGYSVFEIEPPSDAWAERLHGFSWLRHMRASDLALSRENARALVDEWIRFHRLHGPIAHAPEVAARRVLSWLANTPLILDGCDHDFYRRFMRALVRQIRALRRIALDVEPGLPRLRVKMALVAAALSLSGEVRFVRQATRWLEQELDRQILPDGGHVGRNPAAVLETLVDLLPLRQAYTARGQQPPAALLGAVDRMMPMLRFFRLGDGGFARFNGMGETQLGLLATVLAYDDARGAPLKSAPHSGYQRLEAGETVILVDTGPPPPPAYSREAHAGCLSFEMSAGRQPLVVNCGVPGPLAVELRRLARATAAHSTAALNDSSSCRFARGEGGDRPILSGPTHVEIERREDHAGIVLIAAHDGYVARYGIRHERRLMMSPYGDVIEGLDGFTSPSGGTAGKGGKDGFAIRFHLHPTVRASRVKGGNAVLLALPDGSAWEFQTTGPEAAIEESIQLSDVRGSRRSEQIVVYGRALHQASVRWRFRRIAGPQPRRSGGARENGDELPL
ncbi:heparinase II/III family protein [Prosthecomicrobium pneumaticum]|uniref:Putative heparinase superfamily protein n=1 Tax=Prosthecomicrobium pneumaticum TaxID=81895 RepID=A0A7W9FMN8_9HYPH|nr:heparinase II/III family protein [Prosthecomicrobium pneumaticum]MBB5753480.1 putative heparinase superfamily protein [Prosthecomicrobium pneumaticum]